MEIKILQAIVITKLFFSVLLGGVFILTLRFLNVPFTFFCTNYRHFLLGFINFPIFIFSFDRITVRFVLIVLLVVPIVLNFSEIYMEHYNNFKFILLTIIFIISMLFLRFRFSFLNLVLGWDILGIFSIFLIIFYPNKITIYNRLITMFFNRLGDIFIILSFCVFLNFYSEFMNLGKQTTILFLALLMICSFTKRAQFPVSSWLPAAISAPTPISAMVHSSTLVTAGVFLTIRFLEFFGSCSLLSVLFFFRIISFLIGGVLACLELDFKKVIAFSTIRQISLILILCRFFLVKVAIMHIIFHALFKSLLFCGAGFFFLILGSAQSKSFFNRHRVGYSRLSLFFISIFRIRGLTFSSSFFSKDLVLELAIREANIYYIVTLILGRLATIIYRRVLINSCYRWTTIFKRIISKNTRNAFISLFFFLNLLFAVATLRILPLDRFLIIKSEYSFLMLALILAPIVTIRKIESTKRFYFISLEIGFQKFFTYRALSSYMTGSFSNFVKSLSFTDMLSFKPSMVGCSKIIALDKSQSHSIYLLWLFFFIGLLSYPFSLIRNVALKSPKI